MMTSKAAMTMRGTRGWYYPGQPLRNENRLRKAPRTAPWSAPRRPRQPTNVERNRLTDLCFRGTLSSWRRSHLVTALVGVDWICNLTSSPNLELYRRRLAESTMVSTELRAWQPKVGGRSAKAIKSTTGQQVTGLSIGWRQGAQIVDRIPCGPAYMAGCCQVEAHSTLVHNTHQPRYLGSRGDTRRFLGVSTTTTLAISKRFSRNRLDGERRLLWV